jgi:hypothetical protein
MKFGHSVDGIRYFASKRPANCPALTGKVAQETSPNILCTPQIVQHFLIELAEVNCFGLCLVPSQATFQERESSPIVSVGSDVDLWSTICGTQDIGLYEL